MSCVMRKPAFGKCKNKGADQLCSNHAADQHLYFRYEDNTIPLLNYMPLTVFCGCKAWFESDLVGNPDDKFSTRLK